MSIFGMMHYLISYKIREEYVLSMIRQYQKFNITIYLQVNIDIDDILWY